jgi:hypothetical protein
MPCAVSAYYFEKLVLFEYRTNIYKHIRLKIYVACVVVFLPVGLEVGEVGVVTHPDHAVGALQQSLLGSLLP